MNTLYYGFDPMVYGDFYESLSNVPESWAMAAWQVDRLRGVSSGEGVLTAVLDTGCQIDHPALDGRVVASKDFTGSRIGFRDSNGHGTHCCGTVGGLPKIGVAPGCSLLNGKVLSDAGSGSDSGIAAGIDWAIQQGAEIISLSLGSSNPSGPIRAACDRAAANGAWVIAAAGNSGNRGIDFPGGFESTIAVAACDRNFRVAGFSSRGNVLDCTGPGVDIVSARPGGGYQSMSGTSMATPFIAGLLTCWRAGLKRMNLPIPGTTALRAMLHTQAIDMDVPGHDRNSGPGWLAPLMLALQLTPDPPPVRS